ncbi:MAG: hypothetical protein LV468_03010 [Candidatus Nitrosotenuis sp.]|nr:hypothetical protein [Candidatus Nitrosotenuis sp.]
MFSRHPIQVIEADLDGVDGFVMLTRQEKRAAIYGAIRKFLGENGQGDLVERLVRQNKLDVIIR